MRGVLAWAATLIALELVGAAIVVAQLWASFDGLMNTRPHPLLEVGHETTRAESSAAPLWEGAAAPGEGPEAHLEDRAILRQAQDERRVPIGADAALADEPPALAPGPPWTDAHVRDALEGRPLMVRRIVYCEVGRSGAYNPYAIGGQGERGPAQLLPGASNGLGIFSRWGFTEPEDPYQAVAFIEEVIRRGMLGSQYPRTSQGCAGSP